MSDFPHWPVRLTGDVFYVKGRIGWRNLRRSDFCEDGPYLITGMHIRDSGLVDWDTCFHIPRHKFDESPEIQVQAGDLVITKDGTIGKVGRIDWLPGDTSLNSHLFLVRPFRPERNSSRFAFHVFNSLAFRRFIENQKTGSTLAGLGEAKFVKFDFPVPDFSEQELVSAILDTLDTTIRETEAIIAKLKAVKQGLLHDLLTRGLDDNGELRPPQSEAPHLYKQSPLGWIPKEWHISSIGAEFEIQLGKMLDARKNNGVLKPYIGNKAVQWDYIDTAESQLVPLSIADIGRFRLHYGDLLVCEGGEVGRAAIWENNLQECYYQKALHRLRPIHDYSPRLLLELMQWWMNRDFLVDYITKTSIAHLTQEKLADIPLPVPSIVEQNLIVGQLLSHRERFSKEGEKLNKLNKLKSGLMDDLLTGRVRVTPLLNDPPETPPEAAP